MKHQTMTRSDIVVLNQIIEELENVKGTNIKFAYGLARTKMHLKDEIESIKRATTPPEEFLEFEHKRISLCRAMADRDDDGKPVISKNGVFSIVQNYDEFMIELEQLRKQYKTALDAYGPWKSEQDAFMAERVEVLVHQVDLDHFPNDMTPAQLEKIMPMVKEDSPSE